MAQAPRLDPEIDERLEVLKLHRPHPRPYHVIDIALDLLAGGGCLEHLELLRDDENHLDMVGARRILDPTTAGDSCRRLDCAEFVDALQTATNAARLRVGRPTRWSSSGTP